MGRTRPSWQGQHGAHDRRRSTPGSAAVQPKSRQRRTAAQAGDLEASFAMLSGQYVGNALNLEHSERVKATAHFVVRGVSYIITAWLAGELNLPAADLVDRLTSILGELGDPALYRGR